MLPILDKALIALNGGSIEKPLTECAQPILLYATERPVERDTYEQALFYSGKQKGTYRQKRRRYDAYGGILWSSAMVECKIHDEKNFETNVLPQNIPIYADLGFQGMQKPYPQNDFTQ